MDVPPDLIHRGGDHHDEADGDHDAGVARQVREQHRDRGVVVQDELGGVAVLRLAQPRNVEHVRHDVDRRKEANGVGTPLVEEDVLVEQTAD